MARYINSPNSVYTMEFSRMIRGGLGDAGHTRSRIHRKYESRIGFTDIDQNDACSHNDAADCLAAWLLLGSWMALLDCSPGLLPKIALFLSVSWLALLLGGSPGLLSWVALLGCSPAG